MRKHIKLMTGIVIMLLAVLITVVLILMRPKPVVRDVEEFAPSIKVIKAEKNDIPVKVTAYGTARPASVVEISSEVKGIIVESKNLNTGNFVQKDEVILQIDPRDYDIQILLAQAEILKIEASIKEVERKLQDDKERLATLERESQLSEDNFNRMKSLFDKKAISQSELDKSEQSLMTSKNAYISLKSATLQYPIQINSLNASLDAAKAKLEQAKLDRSRCTISSPFTGRIKWSDIDAGQYLTPGMKLLTIADDSSIEIAVSIDSSDSLMLGLINNKPQNSYSNWFTAPELSAQIRAIDSPEYIPSVKGKVLRVENYSEETRTVTLVFGIDNKNDTNSPLLADGMFCKVEIFGSPVRDAVEIPRSAIQFKGRIAIVDQSNRVFQKDATIIFRGKDYCIATKGIENGDLVVISRLPFGMLDGAKVKPVIQPND